MPSRDVGVCYFHTQKNWMILKDCLKKKMCRDIWTDYQARIWTPKLPRVESERRTIGHGRRLDFFRSLWLQLSRSILLSLSLHNSITTTALRRRGRLLVLFINKFKRHEEQVSSSVQKPVIYTLPDFTSKSGYLQNGDNCFLKWEFCTDVSSNSSLQNPVISKWS